MSFATAPEDPRPPQARADRHVKLDPGRLDRQPLAEGLGVGGDHERHVAALPGECLGQGPGHVGQTAGLGEGNGLAGDFEHAHSTRSEQGAGDGQSSDTATIGHSGAPFSVSSSA